MGGIVEISLQLIAEVDKYETVLLRCQSTNSPVTSSPVSPSLAPLVEHPLGIPRPCTTPRDAPGDSDPPASLP
jgi:hypothetical protein